MCVGVYEYCVVWVYEIYCEELWFVVLCEVWCMVVYLVYCGFCCEFVVLVVVVNYVD